MSFKIESFLLIPIYIANSNSSNSSLIELNFIIGKVLIPANIVMVCQTTLIILRSPHPLGFGGNAVESAIFHDTALGLRTFFWFVVALNLEIIAIRFSSI
ncbi:MAG TPA: hypothetical protein VE619_03720 [Nitrososphaeraceae archaeon]|nr:hypothetical protein [Nitrososphaeraceae archaeon]